MKNKTSIFMQLILLIGLVILLPLLFFSYSSYNSYKHNTETKIIENTNETIQQIDFNISKITGQISSIINTYNNNDLYEKFLTKTYSSEYQRLKSIATLEEKLTEHVASLNWISCDIILLGQNNDIYMTNINQARVSSNRIYQTYWYQQTLQNPDTINWFLFKRGYFTKDSTRPAIVATKLLYNNLTKKSYGTIIIEIDQEYLYNLYKDILAPQEIFLVLNSRMETISTNNRTFKLDKLLLNQVLSEKSDNDAHHLIYKDTDYIYLTRKSSISDWTLVKLIPAELFYSEFTQLKNKFFLIFGICIILTLIGIFITALRIYKPIQKLTSKIQMNLLSYKSSNPSVRKPTISSIITGYEQLIQEVDDAVEQLVQENEARRKAELHALEMQINPHFLYNTLNSIKCLVWTNQITYIEPTITSLVKLLQQTLRRTDDLITLNEELENINNYIYIQNIRANNNITLKCNIRNVFYNVKVPPLILQPIVENAIFHGIEPLEKPGIITISAYREENDLFIEVLDNGIGIEENTIKNLLKDSEKNKHGFNQIGLSNVNERLKMHYGEKYGVRIESKFNLGTSVLIRIRL